MCWEGGLHLLFSDFISDCLRLGHAGLCSLFASGHGFLGLWKPPCERIQPLPSGIGSLAAHSDLEVTPGTGTAWLLAGVADPASSTLQRQQRPHGRNGDPSNCRLVVDRGCHGTVSTVENRVYLMHFNL